MPTTTNYGWTTPADTDLVKDGASAIRTLGNGVDTSLKTVSDGRGLVHINTTSFSAVSSISVNDVFSSTYNNYKIMFRNTNIASGSDVRGRLRLRVSGADNSTSNYTDGRAGVSTYGAFDNNFTASKTSFEYILNFEGTNNTFCSLDFYSPFLTANTAYTNIAVSGDAIFYSSGRFNDTTSFTGFTFFPASSTTSGTLSVYGYKI